MQRSNKTCVNEARFAHSPAPLDCSAGRALRAVKEPWGALRAPTCFEGSVPFYSILVEEKHHFFSRFAGETRSNRVTFAMRAAFTMRRSSYRRTAPLCRIKHFLRRHQNACGLGVSIFFSIFPYRCCRNYRHCFRVRCPPGPPSKARCCVAGWGGGVACRNYRHCANRIRSRGKGVSRVVIIGTPRTE